MRTVSVSATMNYDHCRGQSGRGLQRPPGPPVEKSAERFMVMRDPSERSQGPGCPGAPLALPFLRVGLGFPVS